MESNYTVLNEKVTKGGDIELEIVINNACADGLPVIEDGNEYSFSLAHQPLSL